MDRDCLLQLGYHSGGTIAVVGKVLMPVTTEITAPTSNYIEEYTLMFLGNVATANYSGQAKHTLRIFAGETIYVRVGAAVTVMLLLEDVIV